MIKETIEELRELKDRMSIVCENRNRINEAIEQRTKDIYTLNKAIIACEQLRKARKKAKRWKRKYLELLEQVEKNMKLEALYDRLMAEKGEPKVTTTSTDEPMVMQYPQVDGITPTVVKAEQEPCDDAVSRQAVKEVFPRWKFISHEAYLCAVADIDKLPPVRQQDPTGHWIRQDNTKEPLYGWYFCSECNSVIGDKTKFCSNCGARMVDPQERSDKE